MKKISIALHGGAGTIIKSQMTEAKEQAYQKALKEALDHGYDCLAKGGSAIEAVELAVISLENCPLFNAGRGSVYNSKGQHEMDASIMDGLTREAGAVAAIQNIKNPISLAKAVLHHSNHVLLIGEGATEFAKGQKITFEGEEYFHTDHRFEQWKGMQGTDDFQLDHVKTKKNLGTVGAVALDDKGNLAAATSTGGMTNKKFGRVGDSPIIGSGTYADNTTCAVSCTGSGEYFMRGVTAYDISCLMKYGNLDLNQACLKAVMEHLTDLGGDGGVVAIDAKGNISMPFNCEGMYRACKTPEEEVIAIYA